MVSILNAVFAPANTAASAPRRQGGRRAALCASNGPNAARAKRLAIAQASSSKRLHIVFYGTEKIISNYGR